MTKKKSERMCSLENKRCGRNKVKLMEHKLRPGGKRLEWSNVRAERFISKQHYYVDTTPVLTPPSRETGLGEISFVFFQERFFFVPYFVQHVFNSNSDFGTCLKPKRRGNIYLKIV